MGLYHKYCHTENFQLGVMVHACNPSTWEAETGGLQVRGQPQELSETLSQNKRIK